MQWLQPSDLTVPRSEAVWLRVQYHPHHPPEHLRPRRFPLPHRSRETSLSRWCLNQVVTVAVVGVGVGDGGGGDGDW